jgi:hypothetical protein
VDAHEPGKHHADKNRHQRQAVILFPDHFVIEAEHVLAYEACRWSMLMNCVLERLLHIFASK